MINDFCDLLAIFCTVLLDLSRYWKEQFDIKAGVYTYSRAALEYMRDYAYARKTLSFNYVLNYSLILVLTAGRVLLDDGWR